MSNKFYKPKNEYGELLVGQPALEKAIEDYKAADVVLKEADKEIIAAYKAADEVLEAKLIEKIDEADNKINSTISDLKTELEAADENIRISINALDDKVVAGDASLDNKIDTFKTITVKVVQSDSIDSYFQQVIQNNEMTLDELKTELGRTVYLLPGRDDDITTTKTYEEYICLNPEILDKNGRPEMVRLGAVDSILARAEDKAQGFRMGSVELVHGIYDETFRWEDYVIQNLDGKLEPAPGKAVAPYALLQFKQADEKISADFKRDDEEIRNNLANTAAAIRNEFAKVDEALASDITALQEKDASLDVDIVNANIRIDEIKQELMGTAEATDYSGSRIDKIEEAIGISGCPKCGREACNHDDPSEDECTIYCRLDDLRGDVDEHYRTLETIDTLLEDINTKIDKNISAIETNTSNITTNIDNIKVINDTIGVRPYTNDNTPIWSYIDEIKGSISSINTTIGTNPYTNETKPIWSHIESLYNDKANTSDVETEFKSVKDSIDEVESTANTNTSNISKLTTEIGKPGNHRGDNTVWGEINGTKDDIIRIDNTITHIQNEVIGSTEDASDGKTLNSKIKFLAESKADISYVDNRISTVNEVVSTKADKEYVDSELDNKADTVDVDNKLAQKADISYIDGRIGTVNAVVDTKASLSYVDEQITAVNTVIGENKTNDTTIWSAISNLKSQANTADAAIVNHDGQIASNTLKIGDIKSKIGESNTSINRTVWQAIEANANSISENATAIADVKIDADKVDGLSDSVETLTEKLSALEGGIGTSEDGIENGKTIWSAINKNTAEIANNAKNIEDTNKNKLDIATHEASISEINSQIHDLTESIKGIDTNKSDIADIKSAVGTSEDGIENGKTVWSKVNANTHNINALEPRIASLETKTSNMASTEYVNNTVANAISDSVEDINDSIAESMAQTKVEVKDYANSLRVGQPGVAVINCALTSPTPNADGTYGGAKRIHVIDILKGLDSSLFNNLADVNVAVTSTRYIANDNTPGEQITPDIKYYARTSDDGTNARYFEVTFDDFKVEPKYLIMTITYWETNKIILV